MIISKYLIRWESILALLIITEIVIFGMINPAMFSINVLLYSTSDFIYIGIVALPLTLVIVSGGIDISVISIIGLCAVTLGILNQWGLPIILNISVVLILGMTCGLVNVLLIQYTQINPLVITLGSMYLYGGSALLLSGLVGANGYEGIGGFSSQFIAFANGNILGIPIPLVIFCLMAIISYFLLHHSVLGRNLFLIGQSNRVARYSGIPIMTSLCSAYAFVGLGAAISGILLVSYFGSARSDLGTSFLMPVITAVVLGGANIYGGQGSVLGTALATLLIGYLQQGLQMVGIANQISSALSGSLLILVMIGRSLHPIMTSIIIKHKQEHLLYREANKE
ncbi:MAG: ABC transporter permease subunit [Ostreibacterium sp.]